MTAPIRSKCPNCNQTLKVDEALFGRKVRCPSCKHRFVLSSIALSGEPTDAVSVEQDTASIEAAGESGASRQHQNGEEPTIGRAGRFELKALLGHGGFGRVYRAYDPQLDRQLALKVPKFAPEEKKKIRRFLTEAKAAAALRHPNIVAVFESGRTDNQYFIATEYVQGRTLADTIQGASFDMRQAVVWTRDLADALDYAHGEGIVHRDIKPENVMVGAKRRPQIMDFGLAKRLDEDSSMTAEGGLLGTPAYMSPEQARGETQRVGPHSDQYSLGVILYELLTRQKPFEGPPHSVIAKVAQDEPQTPRKIDPTIPDDLQAICLKAMAKDPEHRYENMAEMSDDLSRWLAGRETNARPISARERLLRWCRRNPTTAGLSAALSLAMLLGIVISSYFAIAAGRQTRIAERERDGAQLALQQAQEARDSEAAALEVANRERRQAERERDAARQAQESEALAQRIAARRLAKIEMERGLTLCEAGDVSKGLLWLAQSLSSVPPDDAELGELIRRNLQGWSEEVISRPLALLTHESGLCCGALCLDGQRVVSGSVDGSIRIWNLNDMSFVKSSQTHPQVGRIAVSPDGRLFATGGGDKTARVWNLSDGSPVTPPLEHSDGLLGLAFSPDSRQLLSGGRGHKSRLWDAQTGQELGRPTPHGRWVHDVAFSPDGSLYVAPDFVGKPRRQTGASLRSVSTRARQGPLLEMPNDARAVAFSPVDNLCAVGCDTGEIFLWNSETGETVAETMPHKHRIVALAFSPDGTLLLSGSHDLTVRISDVATGRVVAPPLDHGAPPFHISCAADGKSFLAVAGNQLRIWSLQPLPTAERSLAHDEPVHTIVFPNEGSRVVTGAGTGNIWTWDAATGQPIGEPLPPPRPIADIADSPDGLRVLCADEEGRLFVWNAVEHRYVETDVRVPKTHTIAALHPDGDRFIVSRDRVGWTADQGQLECWSLESKGRVLPQMEQSGREIKTVAFSPDGETIAVGNYDGHVTFWSATTGERFPGLIDTPGPGGVRTLSYSPNGRYVAAARQDNTLWIYDVETREPVTAPLKQPLQLQSFDFSPDSRWVVMGYGEDRWDNTGGASVRLWDIAGGAPIGPELPDVRVMNMVAFSPNATLVGSANRTGNAKLWRVPQPVAGDVEAVTRWVGALTTLELDKFGNVQFLDPQVWQEWKQALDAR